MACGRCGRCHRPPQDPVECLEVGRRRVGRPPRSTATFRPRLLPTAFGLESLLLARGGLGVDGMFGLSVKVGFGLGQVHHTTADRERRPFAQ